MTLTTPYSATFYVGDGETKAFPYLFEEVSESFISVIVYNSLTGQSSTPTYIVDTDQKQVIFGDDTLAPTADETVCIYRNTPNVQDTPFRTLQGYDAKALENILSKIVAMIQEIKSNYFTTQVLQGDPWQLDLLKSADDGATVNIDYVAKKLVKGLYFQITNGNLQVSADGSSYITMPKSADIVEFRQVQTVLEDLTVQYRLQYRIGNEWFNAESNAEATADEAKQIAEEARDIASDAKDIAQDAKDIADSFDDRLTHAEQDASDAKDVAQDASDTVSAHITDTNNPHSVTKAQVGLDNVDNTSDLDKPISTATQTALDLKMPISTKYGAALSLTINSTTYVVTAQLKDQDGNNLGTAQTIDLPLESVVVSGAYDSVTKEVVLTLQGGSTIRFSVADLVSGLQTEITALNMLSADLVDDTDTTHKFVTATEKTNWNNHVANTNNPHQVTKAQVGLGNVDNTSDLNKPISTATQTALDLKADKSTTYTKTETDTLLSGKQDTISDLSTIRSNAQAGKAASDTIATYGDIVTHDASEFATAAQGAKADTALQAGDNVSELVNDAGYLVMGDLTNFVTKNTAQTISGLKTFSADITLSGTTSIKNTTNGVSYTMLYRDASGIHVGTSTQALLLAGSNARPKFNNNDIAMLSDIPTAVSQLTNDTGFITNAVNDLQNYTLTSDLATVATSGSYNDLSNKPTIGNATLTIQKNSVAVDTFTANATVDKSINITVPVNAADVNALPNTTKYVANASMTIDNTTYVVTLQLKDQDGNNIGTAQTVDLPLESVVVSGAYDSVNKKIVLTLKDGSTIDIPVGDLVAGLQAEITSTNKLDADLVDDSTSTNKFVTTSDKTTWNGKQDAISDLATIRSNASSGASAYTTIQGYGNIVTHNASEFATSAQGALADTALQSGDNVSELVNDAGYITGITGSDVTTALGYTPYNSSNPSGYQANVIESIKVNGTAQTITAKAVDITVPTKTSDITNDSGFITSSALAPYALSADLATVAISGSYNDLSNKPTIPTTLAGLTGDVSISSPTGGQVLQYDANLNKWKNSTSTVSIGFDGVTGSPYDNVALKSALDSKANSADLATVATSGSYNDLSNKPTIPTVGNGTITITQGGVSKGTFTTNQSGNTTVALDAGISYSAGDGIDITSGVISVSDLDCGTM